jgi:hypothetical protein
LGATISRKLQRELGTGHLTERDLEDALRRAFAAKMKRKEYFVAFKATVGGSPITRDPAPYIDVSNVAVRRLVAAVDHEREGPAPPRCTGTRTPGLW